MLFPQALAAVLSSTQCVLVLFQLGSKEVQVRRERLFDTTISICWVGVVLITFFFLLSIFQDVAEILSHSRSRQSMGLVIQDDPGGEHWSWHLKPLPKESPCTVGFTHLDKV